MHRIVRPYCEEEPEASVLYALGSARCAWAGCAVGVGAAAWSHRQPQRNITSALAAQFVAAALLKLLSVRRCIAGVVSVAWRHLACRRAPRAGQRRWSESGRLGSGDGACVRAPFAWRCLRGRRQGFQLLIVRREILLRPAAVHDAAPRLHNHVRHLDSSCRCGAMLLSGAHL